MPTISQLPPASTPTAADLVPLSQSGTTAAASVGNLLAGTQPAISLPTGDLLGRNSVGAGGPEPVTLGIGLALNNGTLAALGIAEAPAATTISATDLIGISQSGTNRAVAYATLLDGLTIDLAQPAAPATNSDTMWVAQGTSTMFRQSFAAVWAWIVAQMPTYKKPVVEVTVSTTLDGTIHNGRIVICSQPLTLSPASINMGSGFSCDVINVSGGPVTFGMGIITSTGTSLLAPGQFASMRVATYSGGSLVYASISGSAALPPDAVTGLVVSGATTSTLALSWVAPVTGSLASSYTVQYRPTGTAPWLTASSSVNGTNYIVGGLAAAISYDFQVFAVNGGGTGGLSNIATATTAAPAGAVTAIIWNVAPSGSYVHGSGSIGVNAHVSPATGAVQFAFGSSSNVAPTSWTQASLVNSDLWGAYVAIPISAGTYYAWCEGTDGSAPTVCAVAFTVT